MHVRISAKAIFWETPLKWSTLAYYKLVEYQLMYSFLHYLRWPVNMLENRYFHYGRGRFFAIFKMHLRICVQLIFWETLLKWSTLGYFKLVRYQLLNSFVQHFPWSLNMLENVIFASQLDRSFFCNFQHASPRKCSGHFVQNCTQLYYCGILQTGQVWATVRISIPLAMIAEHARKINIRTIG